MNMQNYKNNKNYENIGKIIIDKMKELELDREKRISSAVKILQEGDEDARWAAAGVLGEVGGYLALDALISALKTEPSAEVRCAILHALSGDMDEDHILATIVNARYNDTSPSVREEAKKIIAEENEFLQFLGNDKNVKLDKVMHKKETDTSLSNHMSLAASEYQSNLQEQALPTEEIRTEFGEFEVNGINYKYFDDQEGKVYLLCLEGIDATHIRLDNELFELKAVGVDNTIREINDYTLADMEDFLIDYKKYPDKHNISFERH